MGRGLGLGVQRVQGLQGLQGQILYRIYAWLRTRITSLCRLWRRRAGIGLELLLLLLLLLLLYQEEMKWMRGLRVIAGRWYLMSDTRIVMHLGLEKPQGKPRGVQAQAQAQNQEQERETEQETGEIANTENA